MMENKDMISKRKTNKLVILLAVIFLASAAGLGGIYAWKTIKNNSSGNGDDITHQSANVGGEAFLDENGMPEDGSDITETRKVGDVKTLRELLLEDGKFAIKLTDDIRIERGFLVNGTKKLVGDKSITMELYAEPFQPILKVQQGATLILDGITLDGNSNATGVEVEKKAGFTSLSGTILYPLPYGVLNHGTTRIKDIKIDRGIDSGLCVMGGSKAYMEGGEISGCSKAAVHVVADGYVHISGNAKLNDSYMCINNRGICEITGGVLSDAWRTLVWNLGEFTVDYEGKNKDDKLEWFNAGEYGIRSGADTKTYINGVYIHDVVKGGIKGITHEGLVVKNCKVENVGTYGVESAKGKQDAVFTDIEVINAKNSGVRVYGEHKVEVTNVTVTGTEGRGIQNGNSRVIAKNIKIVNSAKSGIYGGKGSITEVDNAEILSSKKYGVENYAGTMTIKNSKITDAALSGVIAKKETVTNLSNVTIVKPAKRGIMNLGGTMTADNIIVESPGQYGVTSTLTDKVAGSLTVTNLTVNNVLTDNALNCHATVVTAKNVNISGAGGYGVRVTGGGTMNVTDVKIKNCGLRGMGSSNKNSVLNVTNAESDSTGMSGVANLENITLKNSGLKAGKDTKYTFSYRGALSTTDGTINAKNVTISDSVGSGICVNGGTLNAEKVVVNDAGENGAFFTSSSTYGEAVVKIDGLEISTPKNRGIYNDGGAVELSNVKITNPATYGVTTALLEKTKYAGLVTIKGLNITGVKKSNALNCNASELNIVNGTISDVAKHGAYVLKGGKLTLSDVEFMNIDDYGLLNEAATATLKNVKIQDAQYGLFVNGGTIAEGSKDVEILDVEASGVYIKSTQEFGEAKANIEKLTITNAKKRGVYNVGAEVTLAGVTITEPGEYGVTSGKTSWTVEDKTTTCIGKVAISNLNISGVQLYNALNCNASEMNVTGGTISGVAENGARVLSGGKLILSDVDIKDCGIHGVYATGAETQATLIGTNVSNIVERGIWSEAALTTLEDVEVSEAQYGVLVDGGTTTFDGGKVTKASAQGIYITSANKGLATADIKAVTIAEAGKRGVYNYGGEVTLTGVTITDPSDYGVTTGKVTVEAEEGITTYTGKVTATDLTITGVKKNHALNCNASEMSVNVGTISDVAKYGAYVVSSGQLTLNKVQISTTGLSGVCAKSSATVSLTKVDMNQVGITTDTESDYTAVDKSGVGVSNATVTADTLTVNGAVEDGIYSASATTTLTNTQISNAKYGVYVDGGTTTYEGGKIANVSAQGIYITSANNGLATVNMNTVTIHEVAKRGVHNNGGNVTLTGVTITDPGEYGISSGKANWTVGEETTTFVGKITATDLTVTGVKKNNALHCNASEIEVTDGTLSDIKEYAVRVVGNGKTTLNNVAISQCQKAAVSVQKGTATMTGGTISGTTGYDVDLAEPNGDASATLIGVSITRAEGNAHGSMIIARGKDKDENEYAGTSTLTLDNCNLTGSGTPTTESAITVTKGTLNIQNGGSYTNNVSNVGGGVIYIASAGNVNINQGETKSLVSFTNNGCDSGASASSGGVINVQNGGTFKADTCAFTNNYLRCSGTGNCMGGVISVGSKTDGNVVIKNTTFDGNRNEATKGYGGAVSVGKSCYLTMENCVFGQTTANVAANGKDVRGADGTVFNLSGKIVAEFYNTEYPHILHFTGALHAESAIVMKWKTISAVEEAKVISFASSDIVTSNMQYINLHADHQADYKLAYSTTYKKAVVRAK